MAEHGGTFRRRRFRRFQCRAALRLVEIMPEIESVLQDERTLDIYVIADVFSEEKASEAVSS